MTIDRFLKLLGQICVLCLIVAGPWRNGGYEPAVLRRFLYLIVASGVLALASLWTTPSRDRQKFSFLPTILVSIPLFLGLGLCCLQVCPLSEDTLKSLSPYTIELKKTLLPKNLDVSLAQLSTTDSDENLRNELRDSGDASLNKDFLAKTFSWNDSSSFDVERALIVDQALENELLSSEKTNYETIWGNCVSVYPLATKKTMPLFWGGLVLLFSVSILFNTPESRKFLFKTIVFTGLLFALLCIAMISNPKAIRAGFLENVWDKYLIYGQYGTYVNKNAAGGYLVLIFATCVFLVVREFLQSVYWVNKERKERLEEERAAKREKVYDVKTEARWMAVLGDLFDLFNRKLSFWLAIAAALLATIFMSMSRGAAVSASVATFLCCVLLLGKKDVWRYWYVIAIAIVLSVGVISAYKMNEKVDKRMSTLIEENEEGQTAFESDARWNNWRGALESSKNYRWFGSGLGTYFLSNSPNDVALKNGHLFYYAENVFVQTLLEMGIIGLALIVGEYLLLFIVLGRFVLGRHSNDAFSLSVGAVTLVTGQVLAACGDFGNYLPANLFLFVILCGCILGRQNKKLWEDLTSALAKTRTSSDAAKKMESLKRLGKIEFIIVSVCLMGALSASFWMFRENADSVTRWNLHEESQLPPEECAYMTSGSLNGIVKDFEDFIAVRDDSYEVRSDLAQVRSMQYQLSVLKALKTVKPDSNEIDLWLNTSPDLLLDALVKYQAIGFDVPVQVIRERQDVVDYLSNTTRELFAARRICPLYVNVNRRLIATIPLTTNLSWNDEQLIAELYARRVASFSPYNSSELLKSGYYLAFYKLYDLQKLFLNRTLDHTAMVNDVVLQTLNVSVPPTRLAETLDEIIPDDPKTALNVYQKALKWPKTSPLYLAVKAKFEKTLAGVSEERRDAMFYFCSFVFDENSENYELADQHISKALELDPYNPEYCLNRIRLLTKYRKFLDKDEECLQFIQEVLPKLRGHWRRSCEKYVETAQKNVRDAASRRKAQERVKNEREMDERVRQRGINDKTAEETALPEITTESSEDYGFERTFEEELDSFNIDGILQRDEN